MKSRRRIVQASVALTMTAALLSAGSVAHSGAHQDGPRLQGQVPLEHQLNGRALQGYQLYVEQVGHNNILNRLQNGNLGWVDDCAYVSAYFGNEPEEDPTAGLAVLDVADPRDPELIEIWPGTAGARESQVEGNEDSRMVVVMPFPRASIFGDPAADASLLQIYDVPAEDCTDLDKRGTYNFGTEDGQTIVTHEHRIWRDKIYATVSGDTQPGPSITVVDAADKDNPELLTTWDLSDEAGMPASGVHDLDISPDGTRAYLNIRTARPDGEGRDQGLVILDTSEVANWEPGMPRPTINRISKILYWSPPVPGGSHSAQYMKVDGREYVVVQNEGTGCPAPWAQIVDVNDEQNPITISTFRLEVNDPKNCERTLPDHEGLTLGDPGGIYGILLQYRYGSHYLGVDNVEDATMVAFTWYSSGLRLVDVRDPYNPKEVGYFIPPAIDTGEPRAIPDRAYSFVRFHEGNIWFTSVNGGFWVVRYTGPFTDVPPGHNFYDEVTWLAGEGITKGVGDNVFDTGSPVERQHMAAFLFRMAGDPRYVAPARAEFSDVPTTHPFYREISWLAENEITVGVGGGRFDPRSPVERDQMAAFLHRLSGESHEAPATSPFPDVPTDWGLYDSVTWLAESGITTGFADGTFRPNKSVERQHMAAFLYRYSHR